MLVCGLQAAIAVWNGGWPPPNARPGFATKVFLFIISELMMAAVLLAGIELCWAISMPDWVRRFHEKAFRRAGLIVFGFVLFGFLSILAAALGWL